MQYGVLKTIKDFNNQGFYPTLREIGEKLKYKNTSSVQRHSEPLKRMGLIEKHTAWGLRICYRGKIKVKKIIFREINIT
jgi:Mn-dependent DtxR family transcriptional regulator